MSAAPWIIRPAHSDGSDDFAIGELLVKAFVEGYARKMPEVVVHAERQRDLRDVAAKRQAGIVLVGEVVAELSGKVAASLTLIPPGSRLSEAWIPSAACIRYLGIDQEFRGTGIASALMDEAERLARDEWKCAAVCLHVRRGAHGVARFYEKRGYVRRPEGDKDLLPSIFLEAFRLELG